MVLAYFILPIVKFLLLKVNLLTVSHMSTTHSLHRQIVAAVTREVFYVRREVDLMKTAKVNAYIMHIFGKIELLSIYAT